MDTLLSSLGGDVIDLANTATKFGQGAVASDISGNPIFSQDPAAASYSIGGVPTGVSARSILPLLIVGFIAYKLLVK
jgi:hypothetical protein